MSTSSSPLSDPFSFKERGFFLWVFFWGLLSALFLVALGLSSDLSASHRWLSLLLGAVIVILPRVGLPCFLFAIPLFGNRPGSLHAEGLAILACALNLSLSAALFSGRIRSQLRGAASHPLVFLAALYVLTSLASLAGLPLIEWFLSIYSSVPSFSDLAGTSYRITRLLESSEERLDYSFLSVFFAASGFHLMLLLLSMERPSRLITTILLSLVTSLVVGLLDYYGLINLRFLRDLDPVVNPGDTQFRLQSFFGHSGWFAEFVTLTIPSALIILTLPLSFRWRMVVLFSFLLLGEFVLILTFQRGGWLSYPLTLLAVWASVYVQYLYEKGIQNPRLALKKSAVKILVSLPLTVAISLGLILALNQFNLLGSDARSSFESYSQRFKDISRTKDRSDFVRAGYKLGSLSPIVGLGSESFAYSYRRYFQEKGSPFEGEIVLPLHGSAHNVYFQVFSGQGILGLAALVALVVTAIILPLRNSLRNEKMPHQLRLLGLSVSCFFLAFLVYGNVQEIFYVQALLFLFFAFCAVGGMVCPEHVLPLPLRRAVLVVVAALGIVHLVVISPKLGTFTSPLTYGCYGAERESEQHPAFRWCAPRAKIEVPLTVEGDKKTAILAFQAAPYKGDPRVLQILHEGKVVVEKELPPGGTLNEKVEIPTASDRVLLDLRTAGYVIPRRDFPSSKDPRALAVRWYQ